MIQRPYAAATTCSAITVESLDLTLAPSVDVLLEAYRPPRHVGGAVEE
ncbi:hypothetical protein GA0070608_4890 [Micromonospora peucetia]|uniref:Uncharacterized protein n=1 Tax=Micromonospora peucetia TaxID=47871 RepID=A0A1C6W1C4_9ACTN|nr:hypothetical protein GA0070608_4890 [Micromonospora peucetia]